MASRFVSLLSLGLTLAAGSVHAGTWTALPPLAGGRYGAAAAATPDAIYVVGGFGAVGNTLVDVSAWSAGAWSDSAPLPAARSFAGAASLGSSLLVVGGFEDSGFPSTAVRRFDPAAGGWSDAAALPAGCAAMACATAGGAVFVAGGETDYGAFSARSLRYDPAANAWSPIAPLPSPRSGPAGAAMQGRFYVIGGANGAPVATVEVYDPASNTWSAAAALPEPLWSPAAAAFSGRLWVMGGFDASYNPGRRVYSLGPDGAWREEASLPEPLAQSAAAALGDRLVVAGGTSPLGEARGAAYVMAAEAPPAETLHVAVTVNPATLESASRGQWITVFLESEWLIRDLDLATVTLDGVPLDLDAPQTINHDDHRITVKFPRDPFTRLAPGPHLLALSGLTHNGVQVRGVGALTVIGGGSSTHAPRARLTPMNSGTGQAEVAVTLDQPALVTLDVVDVQGRVLDRIESAYRPAGTYSVTWPGGGRTVDSGLYFMRLRAPGEMAMTRLVVSR